MNASFIRAGRVTARVRAVLVLLALTLLAVPAAAQDERDACFIFVTPSPDWLTVRVQADVAYTEEEKIELARAHDLDGDGALNLTEAQWLVTNTSRVLADPAQMGDLAMYLDGIAPRSVTVFKSPGSPMSNIELEARDWTVAEIRLYDFPTAKPGDAHVLSGGLYARPLQVPPRAVVETLVINSPEGWVVWSFGNLTDPTPPQSWEFVSREMGTEYKTGRVVLDGLDADSSYFVMYAEEGADPYGIIGGGEFPGPFNPTPGPGALVAIVALALVALRARR